MHQEEEDEEAEEDDEDDICQDDNDVSIYLTPFLGYQDCPWLAKKNPYVLFLFCRIGSDAHRHCRSTCGRCHRQSDNDPPPQEEEEEESSSCVDNSQATFAVLSQVRRDCDYVASLRQILRDAACLPSQPAYTHCPQTCNSCGYGQERNQPQQQSDDNNDNGGGDVVECREDPHDNLVIHNVVRDCAWLVSRPHMQEVVCQSYEHDAFWVCPQTCHSCDRIAQLFQEPEPEEEQILREQQISGRTRGFRLRSSMERHSSWSSSSPPTASP